MKWIVVVVTAAALAAEPEKTASSLERQQQSVQRQVNRKRPAKSFFISPWLKRIEPEPVAVAVSPGIQANCDPVAESSLTQLITSAAQEHHVDPQVLRAIIRRESGGRPCAVSPKGAQGLMQLMPATQATLGISDPFDPASNVGGGARYLADLLKRYKGDLKLTLAAYNAGPQKVEPEGTLPDIPETRAYVSAIMADLGGSEPAQP